LIFSTHPPTTASSPPSLHDALPISIWKRIEPATARPQKRLEAMQLLADRGIRCGVLLAPVLPGLTDDPQGLRDVVEAAAEHGASDRKSTRLNSSHLVISYAVFCLKK